MLISVCMITVAGAKWILHLRTRSKWRRTLWEFYSRRRERDPWRKNEQRGKFRRKDTKRLNRAHPVLRIKSHARLLWSTTHFYYSDRIGAVCVREWIFSQRRVGHNFSTNKFSLNCMMRCVPCGLTCKCRDDDDGQTGCLWFICLSFNLSELVLHLQDDTPKFNTTTNVIHAAFLPAQLNKRLFLGRTESVWAAARK